MRFSIVIVFQNAILVSTGRLHEPPLPKFRLPACIIIIAMVESTTLSGMWISVSRLA